MSVKNEDIYKLLCNVHQDIGELKGITAATNVVLRDHIEEDKRIIKAMYDTQVVPMQTQVDTLRLSQATAKGRAKVWALVATTAGAVLGSVAGAATSLIKWH